MTASRTVWIDGEVTADLAIDLAIRLLRAGGLRPLPREKAIKLCADLEDCAHDALRDLTRYPQ